METKGALRAWELALVLALCVTAGTGLWARAEQRRLSDALVRLHVVARSDSPEDQAEKLRMRDRVLAILTPLLADCETRQEAVDVIEAHKGELEALGDVTVTLGTEYYPTRDYDTFSLPAGRYVSLRVALGPGEGKNWWCVVYPALCTEALAAGSEDVFLSLEEEQAGLITREDEGYEIKFRVVEWWGRLEALFTRGA